MKKLIRIVKFKVRFYLTGEFMYSLPVERPGWEEFERYHRQRRLDPPTRLNPGKEK